MKTTKTTLRGSVLSMIDLARRVGGPTGGVRGHPGWEVHVTPSRRFAIKFCLGEAEGEDFVEFRSSRRGNLIRLDGDDYGVRSRVETVYDTDLSNAQLLQLFGWVTCRASLPCYPTDDELHTLEVSLQHMQMRD